jgi:hypothetical protein
VVNAVRRCVHLAEERLLLHLCRLTFELSWLQRQDARPGPVKMYTVPPAWAWWPAVGAPLERGVRRHLDLLMVVLSLLAVVAHFDQFVAKFPTPA